MDPTTLSDGHRLRRLPVTVHLHFDCERQEQAT